MPPNVDSVTDDLANLDIKQLIKEQKPFVVYDDTKYEPWQPFEHKDPGHLGDPQKKALLEHATKVFDLTPHIGTEIHGVQLSQLNDQQKNDLALLVAERGVVFFRNQDIRPQQGVDFGRYFGRLHTHPTTGHPPGFPEIASIYFESQPGQSNPALYDRASDGWHSDITFEEQPAGLEFLKIDKLPGESGGDTLWASGYEAYDRLSPALQKFLEGLEAVHDASNLRRYAEISGRPVRRELTEAVHPVIRTHPVTGWKALYVQPGFTRRIVGLSKRESDTLLEFLFRHIAGGHDFQVRFKWQEDSIAVWDNRCTFHAITFDYSHLLTSRHGWRVSPTAERPYFDPNSKSRREVLAEKKATV